MRIKITLLLLIGLLTMTHYSGAQTRQDDPVAAGFSHVPPEARIRMFWRVFGPAWNADEIDYQFGLLRQAGVGGVTTCFTYPVALDDPVKGIRNQPFLSPEFLTTLGHAAQQARRVDLEFGVCGGTGWPFGGPTVTLEDAAQRIRMEKPKPLSDGSGWKLPALRTGEHYFAVFLDTHNVTSLVRGDRLELPAPKEGKTSPGRPDVQAFRRSNDTDAAVTLIENQNSKIENFVCRVFIAGPTYMKVKRAALGAEGYVVDHYHREAALRYLDAVVAPMLRAAPPESPIRSIFCDSLEVYNANWTHDFPAQFQKRRGYDLVPHLPELFDGAGPEMQDLRFDFWRTCAELAEEEFARPVHDWCKKHHVAFVMEAYGTPPMGFTAARYCEVPWGEQYEWKGFSFSRFAASGGHLAGKKIIGAEAWTWTGIPNRLADSLSDLKLCSDLHFLAGENELTGVDFPYSPRSEPPPGWLPYFGPVLNQNSPQWSAFPALTAYVNRCQWLLRQGRPVADVALYTPTEDSFAGGPTDQMLLDFQLRDRLATGPLTSEFGLKKAFTHHSDVISTLLEAGYNFDGIDFFAMNTLAKVKGRELTAGEGRYRIIVLPNLTGIYLAAMQKIAQFCRAGGTVIATRRLPECVYGLRQENASARLKALLVEMFGPQAGGQNATAQGYGKGRALYTPDERGGLQAALQAGGVLPDMSASQPQEIGHVHRNVGERDFYFVANVGEKPVTCEAEFRVTGKNAALWNPLDGTITPLSVLHATAQTTTLELDLPPRGSLFVCFAPEASAITSSPPVSSKSWQEIPLKARWSVAFDGPDAPPPYMTDKLTSWTQWPGAKFFSGHAVYTAVVDAPKTPLVRCLLRFEAVHEAAEVRINGQKAGTVWLPPYEIDVGPLLKPGANTIQVTVGNLPVNRVLGLPEDDLRPLRAVYGNRFPDPEEKRLMQEPAPSGLIGKVWWRLPAD